MPRRLKKSRNSKGRKRPSPTADDQVQHKYYYDDAHGYERFDAETFENDELDNANPDTEPILNKNTRDSA